MNDQDETSNMRSIRYIVNGDQLGSMSLSNLSVPPGICDGFWSLNTHNQRLVTASDALCMSYCPAFIGPCCTPVRRRDFCRLLRSFTFWLVITQSIMVTLTLAETKSPLEKIVIERSILRKYGSMDPDAVREKNQYWRLLTSCFVHATISHFLICIITEVVFVLNREASWNILRTTSTFFLSSICGSFFMLVISRDVPSVGAGAAILGVFGAFVASIAVVFGSLQWKHRVSVLFMFLGNVVLLIFVVNERQEENWGYFGGLCFGFAYGLVLFAHKIETRQGKLLSYLIGGALSFGLLFVPVMIYVVDLTS